MGSTLDDATFIHHKNLMSVDDSRQTVRNDQRGAVLRDVMQLVLYGFFRLGIQRQSLRQRSVSPDFSG